MPLIFTTVEAAGRPGAHAHGLQAWEAIELARLDGNLLRVTGVPALHGPPGAEAYAGTVTGFLLDADDLPRVYVSGDNASLALVASIAKQVRPVDVALLFAGAASTALMDGALLTLDAAAAVEAARVLDASYVVPLHLDGWLHFHEGAEEVRAAFAAAGRGHRLVLPKPGDLVKLDVRRRLLGPTRGHP